MFWHTVHRFSMGAVWKQLWWIMMYVIIIIEKVFIKGMGAPLYAYSPDIADTIERTTVTGQLNFILDRINDSFLRLEINGSHVRCSDEADYRCFIVYDDVIHPGNQSVPDVDVKHLSITALPKSLALSAVKNGTDVQGGDSTTNQADFKVGDVARFNCSGEIGSDNSTKIKWWVSNIDTGAMFNHTNDVEDGIVSSLSVDCQYILTSYMTYNITKMDATRNHGMKIQCYLDGTGSIQSNVYYIKPHDPSVSDTTVSSTTATRPSTTVRSSVTAYSSTSTVTVPLLGAVIGVLVVVILILGVCLWSKRRNKAGIDSSSSVTYVKQLNTQEPGHRQGTSPTLTQHRPSAEQAGGNDTHTYENSTGNDPHAYENQTEGHYQQLDDTTRATEGPYQQLDDTTRATEGPYQQLDDTTRATEGPYQQLDDTTRATETPAYQQLNNNTRVENVSAPVYEQLQGR